VKKLTPSTRELMLNADLMKGELNGVPLLILYALELGGLESGTGCHKC
jgi:hypothetical protein